MPDFESLPNRSTLSGNRGDKSSGGADFLPGLPSITGSSHDSKMASSSEEVAERDISAFKPPGAAFALAGLGGMG